jgi:outer membrane protein assembly factor BamB
MDALLTAVQHQGAIDLLIADLVMPRISGVELGRAFAEIWPGVNALYISGSPGFEKSLPDVPAPLVYKWCSWSEAAESLPLWTQIGKVLKQARLTGALEDYYASPIGADGKVYIASEHGKVVVLRAAGDWEILAINEFDSDIYATPAASEGQMYIRTRNALYAIGPRIRAALVLLLRL